MNSLPRRILASKSICGVERTTLEEEMKRRADEMALEAGAFVMVEL